MLLFVAQPSTGPQPNSDRPKHPIDADDSKRPATPTTPGLENPINPDTNSLQSKLFYGAGEWCLWARANVVIDAEGWRPAPPKGGSGGLEHGQVGPVGPHLGMRCSPPAFSCLGCSRFPPTNPQSERVGEAPPRGNVELLYRVRALCVKATGV